MPSKQSDRGLAGAKVPRSPAASSEATTKVMRANKRKDTKPELLVRQRLREAGLTGYRLQWKVPGRPDIAWPGKKVALFVNGCFWHRCPHCQLPTPKSNVEYWVVKFERNKERDERNIRRSRRLAGRSTSSGSVSSRRRPSTRPSPSCCRSWPTSWGSRCAGSRGGCSSETGST